MGYFLSTATSRVPISDNGCVVATLLLDYDPPPWYQIRWLRGHYIHPTSPAAVV